MGDDDAELRSVSLGQILELAPEEAAEILELEEQYRTQAGLHRNHVLLSAFPRWFALVTQIEEGYPHGLYEYCASLDARRSIQYLLEHASPSLGARIVMAVEPWDARFTEVTERSAMPVWREEYWWGWRVPKKRNPILDRQVMQYLLPG